MPKRNDLTVNTVAALERGSYEWLEANHPDILHAIERDIAKGATPELLYRAAINETGTDRQIALRIRQAARHVAARGE